MEQRDYLKDQIDQLARFLGKVLADALGLKNEGKVAASMELITENLNKELELNLSELEQMTEEELSTFLSQHENLHHSHLEVLGDLFETMAQSQKELGQQQEKMLKKALITYRQALEGHLNYSYELYQKISALEKYLS